MRTIEFEVHTRCWNARTVVCYRDTWANHIVARERAFFPAAQYLTIETLENPSFVCRGTSNSDYLMFVRVNHGVTFVHAGQDVAISSPFVVIVDPVRRREPLDRQSATLVTIGFRRDVRPDHPGLVRLELI